jgi:hypothetical protein
MYPATAGDTSRSGCRQFLRLIAVQATAGTLDLTVDVFLPSPRLIAQVLGREPPP